MSKMNICRVEYNAQHTTHSPNTVRTRVIVKLTTSVKIIARMCVILRFGFNYLNVWAWCLQKKEMSVAQEMLIHNVQLFREFCVHWVVCRQNYFSLKVFIQIMPDYLLLQFQWWFSILLINRLVDSIRHASFLKFGVLNMINRKETFYKYLYHLNNQLNLSNWILISFCSHFIYWTHSSLVSMCAMITSWHRNAFRMRFQ